MNNYYFFELALFLAFCIRIIPSFIMAKIKKPSLYADELVHISEEKIYKHQKDDPEYQKKHFFFRTSQGYPIFLHSIIYFFHKRYSLYVHRLVGLFFSVLFPIVYLLINLSLGSEVNKTLLITIYLLLSFASFGLFIRNHYSFSVRTFADFLLYTIVFLYTMAQDSSIMLYSIILILLVIVWFSSEFGIQTIVFLGIVLLVLFDDNIFLKLVLFSLILAVIINPKRIYDIFTHKLFHWIWYVRNAINYLLKKEEVKHKGLIGIYVKVASNIYVQMLFQFIPFFPIFLYVVFTQEYSNFGRDEQIILSLGFISIITILKYFLFLGPSARYFFYALPLVYGILYDYSLELFLILFIFEAIFSTLFAILILKKDYDTNKEKSEKIVHLYEVMNNIDKNGNIVLSDPIRLCEMYSGLSYKLKAQYIDFFGADLNLKSLEFFETYYKNYPNLNLNIDLGELIEEYHITHIVLDRVFSLNINNYTKSELLSIVCENDSFIVMSIKSNKKS